MQLEVEALKLYDPTVSNLELTWEISLEWFHSPPIFMGGGNPFGSLLFSKNSKSEMEFGESRIKSNTLVWNKLLRECSTSTHHVLPPFELFDSLFCSWTLLLVQLLVSKVGHKWLGFLQEWDFFILYLVTF
jgi:hypothetical protein